MTRDNAMDPLEPTLRLHQSINFTDVLRSYLMSLPLDEQIRKKIKQSDIYYTETTSEYGLLFQVRCTIHGMTNSEFQIRLTELLTWLALK